MLVLRVCAATSSNLSAAAPRRLCRNQMIVLLSATLELISSLPADLCLAQAHKHSCFTFACSQVEANACRHADVESSSGRELHAGFAKMSGQFELATGVFSLICRFNRELSRRRPSTWFHGCFVVLFLFLCSLSSFRPFDSSSSSLRPHRLSVQYAGPLLEHRSGRAVLWQRHVLAAVLAAKLQHRGGSPRLARWQVPSLASTQPSHRGASNTEHPAVNRQLPLLSL